MTSDIWIQIQHKLHSPHESRMCDPLFNFDLHPSGHFLDFFLKYNALFNSSETGKDGFTLLEH